MKNKSKIDPHLIRNIVFYVFIILLFLAIILAYYYFLYNETRQSTIKSGEISALISSNGIDEYLQAGHTIMKTTCFTLEKMMEEKRSADEIKDYLTKQSFASGKMDIGNSTGVYGYFYGEYIDGSGWEPDDDYEPTTRPWYIEALLDPEKVTVVDPYLDEETHTFMISLAKALSDKESVVSMDFSMDYLQRVTESAVKENYSDIMIVVDPDIKVVAHSEKSEVGKAYSEETDGLYGSLVRAFKKKENGSFSFDHEGKEYIVYCEPVANDWMCISILDTTAIFGNMRNAVIFTILVIIVVVSVMFGIMMKSNRKVRETMMLENDILEKEISIDKISEVAYRDPLTRVGSKAAFDDMAEKLDRSMKAGNRDFSIIMVDVNDLKTINDNYGHEKGDEYLRGCCHMICDTYKKSPVYRTGGDEFVVILQNTDHENRIELLKDIKLSFMATYADDKRVPWGRYSAAVGMADCSEDDIATDQILSRADANMYDDKNSFKMHYKKSM